MTFAFLLLKTVNIFTKLLGFAIIGRVLLSWVHPGRERSTRLGEILYDITEPVMNLARMLPHRVGMMDLSPIIALFGLDIINYLFEKLVIYFLI